MQYSSVVSKLTPDLSGSVMKFELTIPVSRQIFFVKRLNHLKSIRLRLRGKWPPI